MINQQEIKVIIGLGNPGPKFTKTRHNAGFMVVDQLAEKYGGRWSEKDTYQCADIMINGKNILLIKPQTFMNSSGRVIPALIKKGITPGHMLVVHDEIELPFGAVKIKTGGSHKGHNGLRSIIEACGADFHRVRMGVGRPADKDEVPDYVLCSFSESSDDVDRMIAQGVELIE